MGSKQAGIRGYMGGGGVRGVGGSLVVVGERRGGEGVRWGCGLGGGGTREHYLEEQDMQQMLQQAKILKGRCLNGLSALKSNFTRKHVQGITKSEFERAFSRIFSEDVDTFTCTFSQNMDTLEQQLTKETILESMMRYFAFGRHLEEIHVTLAHLEKKRTRLRTYTNVSQDYILRGWRRRHQYNVTPSQFNP
ncbi:hypothetical protein Tco_1237092 [Tanacetum coccineum]